MNQIPRTFSSRFFLCVITAALVLLPSHLVFADQEAFPMTVVDSRMKSVEIFLPPASIVSLSPSLTEIVFAVGAGNILKGVTTYCNFPTDTLSISKIGGFSAKTISIEAIIGLQPDVVFADLSRHGPVIAVLEDFGIPVIATNATSVEDCFSVIAMVGSASGNSSDAQTLIDEMRTRIESVTSITSQIPENLKPRVFWEVYDEPLMTAGPATFIGQLIELSGGINIFGDVSESWPKVSHEELLSRNPEVLMSSESHGEKFTTEQVQSRTGWQGLSAVENGRIYLLDGDIVSRPGPRIVDALELIASTLHPDLFQIRARN